MSTGTDYFVFDGVDSRTFDALVFERNTYSSPEKEYTAVSIPGHSGDLLLPGNRFANVTHEYDVIIYQHFADNFEDLKSFLFSRKGYCRLEDSFHPNEFYHAYYSEPIVPVVSRDGDMGKFTLKFNRKPQRWLLSGEEEITLMSDGSVQTRYVTNPTRFNCYPLLKVTSAALSSGFTLRVNDTYVMFSEYTGSYYSYLNSRPLYIDLNTLQAYVKYSNSINYYYNSAVKYTMPTDKTKAFQLSPGSNYVISNGNTTIFTVTPRWYVL